MSQILFQLQPIVAKVLQEPNIVTPLPFLRDVVPYEVLNSTVPIVLEGLPSSGRSSSTEIYKVPAAADQQQLLQDLIFDVATSFISHGGPSHRIQPVIEALGEALETPTIV